MKKILFLASLAAVAMTSCTSESNEYVGSGTEAKEIAFKPLNQVQTRSAVSGTTFLDTDNFDIVAYLASGGSAAGDFFSSTLFSYDSGEGSSPKLWTGGANPRYWPLSTATINFLAVTNTSGGVSGKISTTFGEGVTPTNYAKKAVVVLSNNHLVSGGSPVYNQADLMYAAGQGTHTAGGAYNNVGLVFQHALALISFTVKKTTGPDITVNSITLNGAKYNGTYTINNETDATDANSGYDGNDYVGGFDVTTSPTSVQWANLKGSWTTIEESTHDCIVPNSSYDGNATSLALTTSSQPFGGGIMVIPDAQATGFTINYTISQGGNSTTYNYTHTFTDAQKNWAQRKNYIFNIDISLHEILVQPTVETWGTGFTGTAGDIAIN